MKKSDPEFYEFLAKSDKELLKFGADDEFDDLDLEEDEDDYKTAPQEGSLDSGDVSLVWSQRKQKTTTMMTTTMTMDSIQRVMARE